MELYVVVTDRNGRPITGLPRDSFEVEEAGERQEIATFTDAGELPLTVGMVIDSSASMFVKLPNVQFAAAEFLRGLATRRDRAFVVGFGSEPRMTRSTTSDLPAVINSLRGAASLRDRTAIWKGIVYSLVQLQGVPGKKALVVYTDGADEDPDFPYRTTLTVCSKSRCSHLCDSLQQRNRAYSRERSEYQRISGPSRHTHRLGGWQGLFRPGWR